MLVLGIESSCDETGVALYDTDRGLLGHAVHTQVAMHEAYGGVVPELASRDHIRRLVPLLRSVLAQSGARKEDIDGIAYTAGPGLAGALLVGASFAASLALALGVPALPVHHLEGHLLSPLLAADAPTFSSDITPASGHESSLKLRFPFVALLVSGGHTQLMRVTGVGAYELLGESVDDAAGEAFDKTAKLLTAVLTQLHGRTLSQRQRADLAWEFQEAVTEVLAAKSVMAVRHCKLDRLVVAGGVGANRRLRQRLDVDAAHQGIRVYYPEVALCTDNGAMIAYCGAQRLLAGERGPRDGAFSVRPRWPLDTLPVV